jgi:hypothetical protein
VDALVLAFIGGLAIALTLVLARTLEQGRELERLRELTGVGNGSDAPAPTGDGGRGVAAKAS